MTVNKIVIRRLFLVSHIEEKNSIWALVYLVVLSMAFEVDILRQLLHDLKYEVSSKYL